MRAWRLRKTHTSAGDGFEKDINSVSYIYHTCGDTMSDCVLMKHKNKTKIVGDGGNSGRIYVPKAWIGKKVVILLVDDDKQ